MTHAADLAFTRRLFGKPNTAAGAVTTAGPADTASPTDPDDEATAANHDQQAVRRLFGPPEPDAA